MKTKRTTRTTEITVERDEVHIISRIGDRKVMWCAKCGRETRMMTPDEAVAFAGATGRAVSQLVQSSKAHFTETSAGPLMICVNSLALR